MSQILRIIQIILAILIIIAVLLQGKNSSLSNLFGGSSNFYATKRGAEKVIFVFTIVTSILFCLSIIADIFIK